MSRYYDYGNGIEEVWVDAAADIDWAFNTSAVDKIHVAPGTYDFTGVVEILRLQDDKHIVFHGDVNFQDVKIETECYYDSDWYGGAATSLVDWDSGNTQWDRDGGNNWVSTEGMTTDWWMHARDAWYSCAAVTDTTFTVNEPAQAPVADLADERYLAVLPTKNLKVEGHLGIKITDTDVDGCWLRLYGLKDVDLSGWMLDFYDCREYNYDSYDTASPHIIRLTQNAGVVFPRIRVRNQEIQQTTSSSVWNRPTAIWAYRCFNSVLPDPVVENFYQSASGYTMYGIAVWNCAHMRIVNAHVSGVRQKVSSGGAYNMVCYTSQYCSYSGVSIAPWSDSGAEGHTYEYGTNVGNDFDVITVTS